LIDCLLVQTEECEECGIIVLQPSEDDSSTFKSGLVGSLPKSKIFSCKIKKYDNELRIYVDRELTKKYNFRIMALEDSPGYGLYSIGEYVDECRKRGI